MTLMLSQIKAAIIFVVIFSIITGIIYPLFITGLGQLFFPFQANGSMLINHNKIVGSHLIGQHFTLSKYFWGRPSATQPTPYNAINSAGSNLSPTNPELIIAVKSRLDYLLKSHPGSSMPVSLELITASASGLDPHISVDGALFQIPRIAQQRKISTQALRELVTKNSEFDNVNVLALNLALDKLTLSGNHNLE